MLDREKWGIPVIIYAFRVVDALFLDKMPPVTNIHLIEEYAHEVCNYYAEEGCKDVPGNVKEIMACAKEVLTWTGELAIEDKKEAQARDDDLHVRKKNNAKVQGNALRIREDQCTL